MADDKRCPMPKHSAGGTCLREKCAWWVNRDDWEGCAIKIMAIHLKYIGHILDSK
jgi:hypothetical protein